VSLNGLDINLLYIQISVAKVTTAHILCAQHNV